MRTVGKALLPLKKLYSKAKGSVLLKIYEIIALQSVKHNGKYNKYISFLSNIHIKRIIDTAQEFGEHDIALKIAESKLKRTRVSYRIYSEHIKLLIQQGKTKELHKAFERQRALIDSYFPKIRTPMVMIGALRAADALGDSSFRPYIVGHLMHSSQYATRLHRKRAIGMLEKLKQHDLIPVAALPYGKVHKWTDVRTHLTKSLTLQAPNGIGHWVKEARINDRSAPTERSSFLSHGKRTHNAIDPIEIFIPLHFYSTWDATSGGMRQNNWDDVRSLFRSFVEYVDSSGIPILPRMQHFMNAAAPTPGRVSISYFSKGGDKNHWHMRDMGLGPYIAVDPDGYFGHSVLSRIDIGARLDAFSPNDESVQQTLNTMRSFFAKAGGDKYNPQEASNEADIDAEAIFCPLQSPKGLEASETKVEAFIGDLTRFSRETGRKVYFRKHPLCSSPLVNKALRKAISTSNCEVSAAPPWLLATSTAATVTINSATAIQAVIAGKPTFTSGRSDIQSVSTHMGTYDEFKTNLTEAINSPYHIQERRRKFVHFYMNRYLLDVTCEEKIHSRLTEARQISAKCVDSDEVRNSFLDILFA